MQIINKFKRLAALSLISLLFLQYGNLCVAESDSSNGKTKNVISVVTQDLSLDKDPCLNPSIDTGSFMVNCFEGLTKLDEKGNMVPGIAESWKVEDGGKKFTFKLRNAAWSDGKPVTAYDFEYSWKRLLNPKLECDNAYILYPVKNAKEYSASKATATNVGIYAKDANTFEVILTEPMPYFIQATYLPALVPLRQDVVENYPDNWYCTPDKFITNGPFTLSGINNSSEVILKKNYNYWDKASIKLEEIKWKCSNDTEQAINEYVAGNVDIINKLVPYETDSTYIKSGELSINNNLSASFLQFNTLKKPFNDKNIRKAISYAIDRKKLTESSEYADIPATGIVPFGTNGMTVGKDFRKESADLTSINANIAEAKRLLKNAGYSSGKQLPELQLLNIDLGGNNKLVKSLKSQLESNLGLKIKVVDVKDYSQYMNLRKSGNYNLTVFSWSMDYNDPYDILSIWRSKNESNTTGWKSVKYDSYLKTAQTSMDSKARMSALHNAEKLIIDEAPISPMFFYASTILKKPGLCNVMVSPNNYLYLQYASY